MLPNCHGLTVLPDGGRFITYTHAGEVNALLRDFFRTVEADAEAAGEQRSGGPVTPPSREPAAPRQRASDGPLVSDEQWNADRALRRLEACTRVEGFDDGGLRRRARARRCSTSRSSRTSRSSTLGSSATSAATTASSPTGARRRPTEPATHRRPRSGGPRVCSTRSGSSGARRRARRRGHRRLRVRVRGAEPQPVARHDRRRHAAQGPARRRHEGAQLGAPAPADRGRAS